jgi:hypothetical protein
MSKNRKYARLDHYGNLLVPVAMLEKIVSECFVVETSWRNDGYELTKLTRIDQVRIHDGSEVDLVLAEQALSGKG